MSDAGSTDDERELTRDGSADGVAPGQQPIAAAATRVVGWVMARPLVQRIQTVLDTFNKAGGGLLAGGLAYAALFALLPALLLVFSVLGFAVEDPKRRAEIIERVAEAVPPLEQLIRASLDQVVTGRVPSSVIGIIGLLWGASRFYGSLDDAMARIFHDAPVRGVVERSARGLLSILLLLVLFIGGLAVTGAASVAMERQVFGAQLEEATGSFWRVAGPVLAVVVYIVGVGLIYRLVPDRHVPWRALLLPALVVGALLGLFTELFALIAPRIIGSAALYGTFVAIFAALIWLGTGFQILLIGAAWVRLRIGGFDPPPEAGDASGG
ncbi:MAG: YihY/virulence factor BrkB family protein [Chloroflexota bacterium]|jgi:membrane protein